MLAYIGVSVAGLAYAPVARAQTPQAAISARMGENQRFDPAVVIDIARQLSKRPFAAPPSDLPDVFANLNQEQYAAIRYTQPAIWSTESRGIAVEPLHRGFRSRRFADRHDVTVIEVRCERHESLRGPPCGDGFDLVVEAPPFVDDDNARQPALGVVARVGATGMGSRWRCQ